MDPNIVELRELWDQGSQIEVRRPRETELTLWMISRLLCSLRNSTLGTSEGSAGGLGMGKRYLTYEGLQKRGSSVVFSVSELEVVVSLELDEVLVGDVVKGVICIVGIESCPR